MNCSCKLHVHICTTRVIQPLYWPVVVAKRSLPHAGLPRDNYSWAHNCSTNTPAVGTLTSWGLKGRAAKEIPRTYTRHFV